MDKDRLDIIAGHLGQPKQAQISQNHTMANVYSPLTTHILDTAQGTPARNVSIELFLEDGKGQWNLIASGNTNNDGRCPGLLTQEHFVAGIYKITFDTGSYFKQNNQKGFYPFVDVHFEIERPNEHYHVPLLLSPFGYSTYRGS